MHYLSPGITLQINSPKVRYDRYKTRNNPIRKRQSVFISGKVHFGDSSSVLSDVSFEVEIMQRNDDVSPYPAVTFPSHHVDVDHLFRHPRDMCMQPDSRHYLDTDHFQYHFWQVVVLLIWNARKLFSCPKYILLLFHSLSFTEHSLNIYAENVTNSCRR